MFGENLRSIRMAREHTQQTMANAVGVELRSYQRYESGDSEPPYKTLVALANFLDIPMDILFGRDEYLRFFSNTFDESPIGLPNRPKD